MTQSEQGFGPSKKPSESDVRATSAVGRYQRVAPIAAGGMATVWAARLRGPAGFNKVVAIKSMLPELAAEPEYRAMFLDEARVTSRLHHPNLCETFDVGEHNGELFIAMEWIDGVSLYRLLKPQPGGARPLPVRFAARILIEACAGLHAAHEAVDADGAPLLVVHRDVSPQNVLLSSDGHVKVTDFGVAMARGKHSATAAGQAKGKLAYMAPEQLRGMLLDRRADVFSLGSVLYEITTGEKPFDAETEAGVARAILDRAPRPPSTLVAGYPEELERIVSRAMAKDPGERFATAEGLRLALERWTVATGNTASHRELAALVHERCGVEIASRRAQIQSTPSDGPVAPATPPTNAPPRFRAPRTVLGVGALVVALGFGSLVWSPQKDRAAAAAAAKQSQSALPSTLAPPLDVKAEAALTATSPSDARANAGEAAAAVTVSIQTGAAAPEAHAQLLIDGEPVALDSDGAAVVERPAAGEIRVGIAKAEGRVDRLFVIGDDTPNTLAITLVAGPPELLTSR